MIRSWCRQSEPTSPRTADAAHAQRPKKVCKSLPLPVVQIAPLVVQISRSGVVANLYHAQAGSWLRSFMPGRQFHLRCRSLSADSAVYNQDSAKEFNRAMTPSCAVPISTLCLRSVTEGSLWRREAAYCQRVFRIEL